MFAWLGSLRRAVARYQHKPKLYGAFFPLACLTIALSRPGSRFQARSGSYPGHCSPK
jgi:hypothetical protein